MRLFFAITLTSLAVATTSSAATINLNLGAFATDASRVSSSSGSGFQRDENPLVATFDTAVGGLTGQYRTEATAGDSLSMAEAAYNVETGELKVRADSLVVEEERRGFYSRASSSAGIAITEEMTAVGSGTVTASMAVDGFWSTSELYGNRFGDAFSFGSSIIMTRDASGLVEATDSLITAANTGLAGVADFVLTLAFDVTDGEAFSLRTGLGTMVPSGQSDFFNTATFSLATTDGLTLDFATAGYLSKSVSDDPATPPAVPLPAGAWFMLSALLGITVVGRGRKQAI